MAGARPSVFSRSSVTGLLLGWSMRQERLKTQLFASSTSFPRSARTVRSRATSRNTLETESAGLPHGLRRVLGWAPRLPSVAGPLAGLAVRRMARAFILAEGPQGALGELRAMRDRSTGFTVDLLGEAAVSEREAEAYAIRYLELIEVLADAAAKWPRSEHLEATTAARFRPSTFP